MVLGMDKQFDATEEGGTTNTNAAEAILKFKEVAKMDVCKVTVNPKDIGVPLDNSHLYFVGVQPEQYTQQVGNAPPEQWQGVITDLVSSMVEKLALGFVLEDFLLDPDDPDIVEMLEKAVKDAAIPPELRKGNQITKRRRVRKSEGGRKDSAIYDFDDAQEDEGHEADPVEQQEEESETVAFGDRWMKRATRQAKYPKRKGDTYEWVHPKDNPYGAHYQEEDVTYQAMSWRERDVVLHNDRVRPVQRESKEEFLDVYTLVNLVSKVEHVSFAQLRQFVWLTCACVVVECVLFSPRASNSDLFLAEPVVDFFPPLSPSIKAYRRRAKRMTSGLERLSVNGYCRHDAMAAVARNRQNQFAGEQFNAFAVGVVLIAMLAVFDYY